MQGNRYYNHEMTAENHEQLLAVASNDGRYGDDQRVRQRAIQRFAGRLAEGNKILSDQRRPWDESTTGMFVDQHKQQEGVNT